MEKRRRATDGVTREKGVGESVSCFGFSIAQFAEKCNSYYLIIININKNQDVCPGTTERASSVAGFGV